jgi:hypothetical protein
MKLTVSSKDVVTNVVNFICKLVFKDELEAIKQETQASSANASRYISAVLKLDNLTDLERQALIDSYIEMNPYYKKLKDDHGIAPHISRLAKDMDIISQNEALVTKYPYLYYYRTIYKECLTSFYATSYSVAMTSKDNYREFALMTVNIMAYINLMRKWLENPFDIEIMSEPDIDRFMFSFGITFFRDLPFKYKTLIARNLNKLIASKGTDRVIVDILEIFNFSGIDIYKYYLAKEATDQPAGSKSSNWLINKNLDVYFLSHTIKIPSLQIAMKNNEYKKTRYEKMVSRDPYWQIEKHEIAAMDFDFVETKYFSIESGFDFTTELLNSSLMFNLIRKIRSDYKNKEFLSITSRSLPGDGIATLEDILVTIQVLTCDLYNVPDTIEYSLEATANVNSFAKKDLVPAINTQLFIDHPDVLSNPSEIALENLDTVPRFDRYTTSGVFKKNSLVKDKLFHLMKREVDYKKYKTLKSAYNSKFYQKLNYDLFRPYASFSSYLEASSPDLYSMIEESRNTLITSEKQALIKEQVTLLTNIANSIIDSFFFFFDTTSLTNVIEYMRTVLMAFKSYTTTLLDIEFFIQFREDFKTKLLDSIEKITTKMRFEDSVRFAYKIFNTASFDIDDKIYLHDYFKFVYSSQFKDKELANHTKDSFTYKSVKTTLGRDKFVKLKDKTIVTQKVSVSSILPEWTDDFLVKNVIPLGNNPAHKETIGLTEVLLTPSAKRDLTDRVFPLNEVIDSIGVTMSTASENLTMTESISNSSSTLSLGVDSATLSENKSIEATHALVDEEQLLTDTFTITALNPED